MKTPEQMSVTVAGQEIRLEVEEEERRHVEAAATQVTERIRKLSERTSASPARMATMVAFQFACDLSIANELLDEAEKLHEEVKSEREAVKRLEALLEKADDALTA